MKGAIYYVAIAMVILSHVKIPCYFHIWRYQIFAQELTWYFTGVYIINMFILQSTYSIAYRVMFSLLSYPLLKLLLMVFSSFPFLLSSFFYCMRIFCNFSHPNLGPWFYCRIFIRSWATSICSTQKYIFESSIRRFLGGSTFQHFKIKREQHWK